MGIVFVSACGIKMCFCDEMLEIVVISLGDLTNIGIVNENNKKSKYEGRSVKKHDLIKLTIDDVSKILSVSLKRQDQRNKY